MSAYVVVLALHSLLRWVVLGLMLTVIGRSLAAGRGEWTRSHEKVHAALVGLVDAQFVLGLVLYAALSPIARLFFADPGGAMKDPQVRFFGVEHLFGMLIAVAIVHVGRVRSKRATEGRHRRVVTWLVVALLVMVGSIPWPWKRTAPRPLLRGVSSVTAPSAPPAA